MLVDFITDKDTTVTGEFVKAGIRERKADEPVHWRDKEDNEICPACGGKATIWLSSETNHGEHPARCTVITETANKLYDEAVQHPIAA